MVKASKWCVLILALFMAAGLLSACGGQSQQEEPGTETVYTLSFGLNDADSGRQEITMEEAGAHIRGVIESYGYGYTEYETYGAYQENGESKGNDTLVYFLVYVEPEDVEAICSQVMEDLNLASVLCQRSQAVCELIMAE